MAEHRLEEAIVFEDPAAPSVADLTGELDADRTTELMTVNIGPHHPATHGVLRLVAYARAELDPDIADDPLLNEVGWSWLTEALEESGADYRALGGTVTHTSSARFGDISGPARSDDIELRASWTPTDSDMTAHAAAFCALLASTAGLPPVGVTLLSPQRG